MPVLRQKPCQPSPADGISGCTVDSQPATAGATKLRKSSRARKLFIGSLLALAAGYLLLLIPESDPPAPTDPTQKPFAWNQNVLWSSLEARFKSARTTGCATLAASIESTLAGRRRQIDELAAAPVAPDDARLDSLETNLFHLAPMIAACPERLADYIDVYSRMREVVKTQSQHWDMNSSAARQRLYRLLYGGRAALEEVLLQAPAGSYAALLRAHNEPSSAPSVTLHDVTLRSGDILVSRGGAPNSALIARGNDFPGNFSHVALLHIDAATRAAIVIEAHIDRGVAIAPFEQYLKDKKLRIMALRLRADLPAVKADPQLPHRAAAQALADARSRHIPYDFTMNYREHSKQFCSEVASAAYEKFGVTLWMGRSHLSSSGLRAWLGCFGARHFETQEPADLEYDPQLRIVAEWRDPAALWQDHLDSAVIDALLEGAERGDLLNYPRLMLPIARLAKAWSAALNLFGVAGPIPEGMSATAALRNKAFARHHTATKARVGALAEQFRKQHGYAAPYWELVNFAREAAAR